MAKVGVLVLADGESHESMGRVTNALMVAKEYKDAGEEVQVIFDGGGTRGALSFADSDHEGNKAFEAVRDVIAGACEYCAGAFGATEGLNEQGITLLDEYEGHPSLKKLIDDGYEIVSF